jgi:hypothetical protein
MQRSFDQREAMWIFLADMAQNARLDAAKRELASGL